MLGWHFSHEEPLPAAEPLCNLGNKERFFSRAESVTCCLPASVDEILVVSIRLLLRSKTEYDQMNMHLCILQECYTIFAEEVLVSI